ncbi:MAG: hypothetical protein NTU49_09400 [Gammaproteobacteria bacterium]|nr:hypothetical protein [Gammaproteobacteria bacterium]
MIYKHIVLLIGLSVAAIFFQTQLMNVLQFFMYVHAELAKGLGVIFSLDRVGEIVQSVLALLLIPIVLAILIGVAHYFIRQHHFEHPMMVIWVCWAVLLASVLSQTGRVTNHPTDSCQSAAAQPTALNPQMQNMKDAKNPMPDEKNAKNPQGMETTGAQNPNQMQDKK